MVHQGRFNTRLLGFGVGCWSKTRETVLPRERLVTAGRPYPLRQEEPKRRGGYPCLQALSHEATTAPSAGATLLLQWRSRALGPCRHCSTPTNPRCCCSGEAELWALADTAGPQQTPGAAAHQTGTAAAVTCARPGSSYSVDVMTSPWSLCVLPRDRT